MKPVLCLGDACIDLLIPYADALRIKSEGLAEQHAADAKLSQGGSVANTACAIARLSVPAAFSGTCGNDAYGHLLKRGLESEDVSCEFLRMDENLPTQLVILVLNAVGDRTAFACPAHGGSQHAIMADQLPHDLHQKISWLHVSGMMLREDPAASTQIGFMKKCYESGVPVSFDVNARVESLGDPFFYHNLQEAKRFSTVIFGSATEEIPLLSHEKDTEKSAFELASNGTVVIARSGDQGADLYNNGTRTHFPAYPVSVEDTVGAGDTFNGAFIAAQILGYGLSESVQFANAAAAICVSKSGARSCPSLSELKAFLNMNSAS